MTDRSDRLEGWLTNLRNFLARRFLITSVWLQIIVIIALILGIGLRFTNLDTQVFWHDETYTFLRVSGYTAAEVKEQIFTGDIINQSTLARFQDLKPSSNLGDTIYSLAVEDPQHPPLYYILARLWVEVFGNSVFVIRCLSAIISLAVFPAMYWLCRELFKVPHAVAIIAIALVAVSPIHLLFAQEAREYVLWMVTVLVASAAFLRAIRLEEKGVSHYTVLWSWGLYAITLIVSFYTFLFSLFVAVAHGVYILFITRFGRSRLLNGYATALLLALVAYIPWMIVIINNYDALAMSTAWTQTSVPRLELIQSWLTQIRRIFFDLEMDLEPSYGFIITPFFVLLVGYGIYFLVITTSPRIWGFILALICIPAGVLIFPDFTVGGIRSLSARYMLPSYLGIEITIAYLLAHHLYNGLINRRQIWQGVTLLILVLGLFTGLQIIQSDVWWHKVTNYNNPAIANIINRTNRPVLISNDQGVNYGNVFSLSYSLQPRTRYQLVQGDELPRELNSNNINNNTNIFLLNPSPRLRNNLEQVYQRRSQIIYRDHDTVLYQINPR